MILIDAAVVWAKIGDFLYHIAPAIIGVVLGAFLVQWYWVSRANESALIEYFTEELTDLVDETTEYWSLDCRTSEENRQRARMLEQRIKASIKNLNSSLGQYSRRYCKKVDFTSLMGEVNDACTGGTFETAKRAPDPARFSSVVNATHRIRWQLLQRRV